jgi:hypothetical protein
MKQRTQFWSGAPSWWTWFWAYVQTADFLAQSAHLFSAWAITMTAAKGMPWYWAAGGFFAYTSFKELVFDNISFGEGHGSPDWLDWLVNCVGIGVALFFERYS